jgi:hypothetical protein
MTQFQLIQQISVPGQSMRIDKLGRQLKSQNFSLRELVELTFYADEQISCKASRILKFIMFRFPENYIEDIGYLVDHVANVKCTVCKKYYAKIIMRITSPDVPKSVRERVKEINFEHVVELCFKWLRDPKMLKSVRSSAAEALFNLRHRYPWIAEGLSNELEAMVPNASPMLRQKANYILSFLHCED